MKVSELESGEIKKTNIIKLSETIETVIYTLSTKQYDYQYYVDIVKNTYKQLCELIKEPKQILPFVNGIYY